MLKIKKIKPMFNAIVTTMDKYEDDVTQSGIITKNRTKGAIKEYQKVVTVGTAVRDIKEGDLVKINPSRYEITKYSDGSMKDGVITTNSVIGYKFDIIEIDNKEYLYLRDNDIDYIVTEYEEYEVEKPSSIVTPNSGIIIPDGIVTC
jgi:co-chaperonin GroES (HSP10)